MNENEKLAYQIIQEAVTIGVCEFCICPGNRNSALFTVLMREPTLSKYFWFEERSGAFFSLGRSKRSSRPVAVITTSGTAAGELLPAAMEAYYTGIPLLLITADRPRRFRGSGAPQSAEQVGMFGIYAPFAMDIAAGETCSLTEWNQKTPAHINVCFEDPFPQITKTTTAGATKKTFLPPTESSLPKSSTFLNEAAQLNQFLKPLHYPFVVVSALRPEAQQAVADFLLHLNAPVFLEGVSGLREMPALQHLRITRTDGLWQNAIKSNYPVDGILRIGGIPTFRMWRDLEDKQGMIPVFSISDQPFSGISWGQVTCVPLHSFFSTFTVSKQFDSEVTQRWITADQFFRQNLLNLFEQEPEAEPSLLYALTKQIPMKSQIYLGNSLPIREWDLAACNEERGFNVCASRGVNGIDGQLSTFLGWSQPNTDNWTILGDLTTLYDLAGPWILPQISETKITILVINNGGGKIFARFLPNPEFQNTHDLNFEPIADMWSLHYEKWNSIPKQLNDAKHQLIELVPNNAASERFWKRVAEL